MSGPVLRAACPTIVRPSARGAKVSVERLARVACAKRPTRAELPQVGLLAPAYRLVYMLKKPTQGYRI